MGLFTWIRWLLPINDFDVHLDREIAREIARRRGSNPSAPGSKPAAPAGPPAKPQPTGGRLIYPDRDPGPVPPRLPDDLDGAAAGSAPTEVPSNELMEQWRQESRQLSRHSDYAIPASSFIVQRVVAWARQQQAQSVQLLPLGADPVATDQELWDMWTLAMSFEDARRAFYNRGRADERAAIAKALGVEP